MIFNDDQKKNFIDALNFVMPYGKYKGRHLHQLPGHYLAWFNRQGFPENKLGQQLALVYEIDHNGLKPLFEKYYITEQFEPY